MIRDVIIHIEGELPVLTDLRALPGPADLSIMCTNMRTTDGKRPTFIESSQSWFVVPLSVVRFMELPSDVLELGAAEAQPGGLETPSSANGVEPQPPDAFDVEPDETLLQRIRDI